MRGGQGSFVCLMLFWVCLVARADDVPSPPANSNLTKFQGKACIAKAEGRGAGAPLSSCPDGTEKDGLLCYHLCSPGYHGVGPVCWRNCPGKSLDIGAICLKSRKFFKRSYGRGAGTPLGCSPLQEQNGALCYKQCQRGYSGEGPVCWEEARPAGFPVRCNRILYTSDEQTCAAINSELIKTGTFTAACLALAMVAATGTGAGLLLPAASFFCGKSFDSLVSQVQEILQLSHARACTP